MTPKELYKKWSCGEIDGLDNKSQWDGNCVKGFVAYALHEHTKRLFEEIDKLDIIKDSCKVVVYPRLKRKHQIESK